MGIRAGRGSVGNPHLQSMLGEGGAVPTLSG